MTTEVIEEIPGFNNVRSMENFHRLLFKLSCVPSCKP